MLIPSHLPLFNSSIQVYFRAGSIAQGPLTEKKSNNRLGANHAVIMQFPSSSPFFLTVTSKYIYPSAPFYRRMHALSSLFLVVNDQCLKKLPNSLIPLNASIALYPQNKYHIQFTIAYMKFQFRLENLSLLQSPFPALCSLC
jgi:hypothetical protein